MSVPRRLPVLALSLLLPAAACGGGGSETDAGSADTAAAAAGETAPAGTTAAAEGAEQARPARTEPAAEETRRAARQPSAERAPSRRAPADGGADATPASRVRTVPAGSQIWATFDDTLDTETAAEGDRFTASVTSPVTDGEYVLIPPGARLHGHLTRVRPARDDSTAMIAVAFDSVQVRETTLPLAATVTDVKIEERRELKGEGKKIGLGAAAGAVVGAVVGRDVRGAIIGAAGGAAAGTAVTLGTRARYAVLPAGSEVTMELDEPLDVPLPRE